MGQERKRRCCVAVNKMDLVDCLTTIYYGPERSGQIIMGISAHSGKKYVLL